MSLPEGKRIAAARAATEAAYRRAQVFGLLLLAAALLAAVLARADMHRLFPPGWWRF